MGTATTADAAGNLRELLAARASREAIQRYLDGLVSSEGGAEERSNEVLSLGGREVGRLYSACAGGPTLTLEDFVPKDAAVGKTVIFEGRNSLPAFSSFQKRFARVKSGQIVGYNHQTMSALTGPGYFVVRPAAADSDVPGELYFDYTTVPDSIPEGWPAFKPNDSGFSNLVYKNMKDYMRQVASNVVVGKAYKLGKPQNAFFILTKRG